MKRLIYILLIFLVLFACVPTPSVEPIPNKSDSSVEQIIHDSTASTTLVSFPSIWNDEIITKDWNIPIQADIVTSGQPSFPVRIVESYEFSPVDVNCLCNLFFTNVTGVRSGFSHSASEYNIAIQNAIELNRSEYANILMEEMSTIDVNNSEFSDDFSIDIDVLPQSLSIQEDNRIGSIYATKTSILLQDAVDGVLHYKELVEAEGSYDGDFPRKVKPSVSLETANDIALTFLKEANISGFSLADSIEARYFDTFYSKELSMGWLLIFAKAYEYYPLNVSELDSSERGPLQFETIPFSKPWDNERIMIYVSQEGIQSFRWDYPTKVVEVINQSVCLLPVEKVEPIIKRVISYGLPTIKGVGRFRYAMKITKLILSVSLQTVKDDVTKAYTMPTWVCCIEVYDLDPNTNQIIEPSVDRLYYGFNAIDGSYLLMNTILNYE